MQVLYREGATTGAYDDMARHYLNEVRVVLRKWQAPGYANPDVILETMVRVGGESALHTDTIPLDWKDSEAQRHAIETFDALLLNHPTLGATPNDPG
jgi:hypothetical protein